MLSEQSALSTSAYSPESSHNKSTEKTHGTWNHYPQKESTSKRPESPQSKNAVETSRLTLGMAGAPDTRSNDPVPRTLGSAEKKGQQEALSTETFSAAQTSH